MDFWRENVEQIVAANGYPLLTGPGSISHRHMEHQVGARFLDFEQQRRLGEAKAADAQDEAELRALEAKVRRRRGASS